jgi:hypothetical protein
MAAGGYMQVPEAAPVGMLHAPDVQATVAVHIGLQVAPPPFGPAQVWPGEQVSASWHGSPMLAEPAQSHSVVVGPDG